MGFWARLFRIFKANANAALDAAEDPEKILNQLLEDMTTQLNDAKKQVAVTMAQEKMLEGQYESSKAQAKEWEQKAMLAVKRGNDELAREALTRKKEFDGITVEFKKQLDKQHISVEELKSRLRSLSNKIQEAGRRKGLLIAKKKRADAQKTINATLEGLNNATGFSEWTRMEEKIEQSVARAEAESELASDYSGDTLNKKFEELEMTAGADEDLIALKRSMGVLPPEPVASNMPVRVETSPTASDQAAAEEAVVEEELARMKANK